MMKQTAIADKSEARRAELEAWLAAEMDEAVRLEPVATDASFRRYFRLQSGDGTSLIAMDAPPEHEDTAQFIAVGALMRAAGLHVPSVHAAAPTRGFAVLADLGRQSYLEVIDADNAEQLIDDALAALVRWQAATRPQALPLYDEASLRAELDLFRDWYVEKHLGRNFDAAQCALWERLCNALVDNALAQPRVFVHRDFILRNLMVSEPNPGVIDFQDARVGPLAYDLVSLFRDAFYSFDEVRIASWRRRYLELARAASLPVPANDDAFAAMFDRIGMQRHLKVVGIFSRLAHRDKKTKYVGEIPRFLGYLRMIAPRYPDMHELVPLLDSLNSPERA